MIYKACACRKMIVVKVPSAAAAAAAQCVVSTKDVRNEVMTHDA